MTRVLVIGHGMVGARFLAELRARQVPDLELTVIGEEAHRPYNRLLLADALAGAHDLAGLTLPETPGVTAIAGCRATAVDRAARVATDDLGGTHPYDVLVLATGAAPRFPAVDGLVGPDERPLPGVTALRTWDDALRVRQHLAVGARVVVLGGGLLGVEAARAVVREGVDVTIVHRQPQPLDRQLDPVSGGVLRAALTDLGVTTRTGVRVAHITRGPERIQELRLSDGSTLPADLVVVAAGVRPRTRLALAADLWVHHGVLVDAVGATDDPHIFAIGDCAEPASGCQGLVGPGWEQARVLADELADRLGGVPVRRDAPAVDTSVVRLKADGLDVVTMGTLPPDDLDPGGPRVVSLVDLAGRRRVRVAVSDGRITGATCVGDPQVAADLTVAFENRFPVPDDPAALLARPLAEPAHPASVADLPGHATICRCNAVSKDAIVHAIDAGAASIESVADITRATTGCGTCAGQVCALLETRTPAQPGAAPARAAS